MKLAVLIWPFLAFLFAGPALPTAPPSACGLLQRAAAAERKDAAAESVIYRGTQVNVETGDESRFALAAQRGEQLLYILWGIDGAVRGVWVYQRGKGWGWTPGGAVTALSGDSLQSWLLLAMILSPNRYSALSAQAQSCRTPPLPSTANPVLHATLAGGLEVDLTIGREDGQLARVERLSGTTRRTTAFLRPRLDKGKPRFDAFQTLRDGVPHRLYRIESVSYGRLLPDPLFSEASLTTPPPLAKEAP